MGHPYVSWVIVTVTPFLTLDNVEWIADKGPLQSKEFRDAVNALDESGKPENYYLPFAHDSLPRPALTAPVCELVSIIPVPCNKQAGC